MTHGDVHSVRHALTPLALLFLSRPSCSDPSRPLARHALTPLALSVRHALTPPALTVPSCSDPSRHLCLALCLLVVVAAGCQGGGVVGGV